MLPFIWSSNIPQFVFKSDIGAILNKHSCEALCSGPVSTLKLLPAPNSSISFAPDVPNATVQRPVARASPKKSHTLKKRKASNSQSENSPSVPPPTAIADLQRIGARLRIAPEKISTDKLVADPAKSSSIQGSDD